MSRKTLESWLRESLLAVSIEDEKKCSMISLVHHQGTTTKEIRTINMLGSKQWEPRELASLIRNEAETHAGGIPGRQVYEVLRFYGKTEPEGSYPFACAGEQEGTMLGTEAPTPVGQLQQDMRFREAQARMYFQATQSVLDTQQKIIESVSKENERLRETHFEAVQLAEAVVMKAAEGEHSHQLQVLKAKRNAAIIEKGVALLPAALNTLLGKEVVPQAIADTALVDSIAESLDDKQLEALFSILKPEQVALLAPRIEKALDKKMKAKQEVEATEESH
jgi:hypothetical protein